MTNPWRGFDHKQWTHWAWVFLTILGFILTIPALICGILPAVIMWVVIAEFQPDDMNAAMSEHAGKRNALNKQDADREWAEYKAQLGGRQ